MFRPIGKYVNGVAGKQPVRFLSTKSKVNGKKQAYKLTEIPNKFNRVRSSYNLRPNLPGGLAYIPPPSAPPPSQTPSVFLPESDPRKHSNLQTQYDIENMPALNELREKKYHLTDADAEEIRRLRAEDPVKWTRKALSKKFGCSPLFISLCSSASPDQLIKMNQRVEFIKEGWSERKKEASELRKRRREIWNRDE